MIVDLVQQKRALLPRVGGVKLLAMLESELASHHISIGRDAFYAILRNNALLVPCKRRYAVTTQSDHHFKKWPDLVQRRHPARAEEIWVSDITYLRTQTGFIYLSLITDAFSRKIVGYHLSQNLKAVGCIAALNKALTGRSYPDRSLIHHSDRGIQYCCDAYVKVLSDNQVQISMTQDGSPYDNAIAERINGILKAEFDLYRTFDSYKAAIDPVCRPLLLITPSGRILVVICKHQIRHMGVKKKTPPKCFLMFTSHHVKQYQYDVYICQVYLVNHSLAVKLFP